MVADLRRIHDDQPARRFWGLSAGDLRSRAARGPLAFAEIEARAEQALSPSVLSALAAADLARATQRSRTVSTRWSRFWPTMSWSSTPLPGHRNLAKRRSCGGHRRPDDRLNALRSAEDVPLSSAAPPALFQLYSRNHLAASLVSRAEAAVDRWGTWHRHVAPAGGSWYQREHSRSCAGTAWPTTSPIPSFRSLLGKIPPTIWPPPWGRGPAVRQSAHLGRPSVAALAHHAAAARQGHLPPGRCPPRQGRRGGRDLLLEPRWPTSRGGCPCSIACPPW